MTKKERSDIYTKVTERIVAELESGAVPWRKPWNTTAGNGPCNANSKRPYRGWNQVVTLFSGYGSPFWATYKGWKKLAVQTFLATEGAEDRIAAYLSEHPTAGREGALNALSGSVRKGEKGTLVVGWKKTERTVREDDEDGTTRDVKRSGLVGFGYTVFNLEQVEGATVPQRKKDSAPELDPIEAAQAVIDAWLAGDGCSIGHGGGRAFYNLSTDAITLPEFQEFKSAAAYYHTAYHEMAHATGAGSRLGRFTEDATQGMFGSESYSKEELVAEFSAAFVSASIGLEQETEEQSAAYIAGWLRALKDDKRLLISAASKAQAAADFIISPEVVQEEEEEDAESEQQAA